MTDNDLRILELKERLKIKEEELKEPDPYNIKTSLQQDIIPSLPVNMNTLTITGLCMLRATIISLLYCHNDYHIKNTELKAPNGYLFVDILSDTEHLISKSVYKNYKKDIDAMRKKLEALLTSTAKTTIALDEIEGMI
ncbi:MAG: hypothetical protein ACRCRT_06750 [Cetobacterium somerae]